MKSTMLLAVSLATLAGCSFAARSPEMYRDDTGKELAKKSEEIRACYDGVLKGMPNAGGRVTVAFEVQKDGEDGAGKLINVQVDKANTNAPDPVIECVTKNIAGVAISPPDKRLGQATWAWEFAPGKS